MVPAVTVVGSLNTDLVIQVSKLPGSGETILGGTFATFGGGKGANQAVAAARLGARTIIVGCVGDDGFGAQIRTSIAAEGIDTTYLRTVRSVPSGVALITVDAAGANTIVVASGANGHVSRADVDGAEQAIAASQVLLLQLEIPLDVVTYAAALAQTKGVTVVLDPAPAIPLPPALNRMISVIHPNEHEAEILTGVRVTDMRRARAAAEQLLRSGSPAVVIKLGARGAYLATPSMAEEIPGIPVEAVDTTAAGDAFAGAIAVALAEGKSLSAAAHFANVVGALKVTRLGAQPGLPTRDEVIAFARAHAVAI